MKVKRLKIKKTAGEAMVHTGWSIVCGTSMQNAQILVAGTKAELKEMAWNIGWFHADISKAQRIAITSPDIFEA